MAYTPIAQACAYANCPRLLARKVLVKLIVAQAERPYFQKRAAEQTTGMSS